MLNSIGLQNIGGSSVCAGKVSELRRLRTAVFANVFGYEPGNYAEVIRILEEAEGLAGYEINVSCPNTLHGGIYFSSDPALLSEVVKLVRPLTKRPLIVKLSPNVGANRAAGSGRRAGRRRRNQPGEHVLSAGHRPAYSQTADWRWLRRTLRACDQAHRAAPDISGRESGPHPGDRHGRHQDRTGCCRVPDRRGYGRRSRHREFLGSSGAVPHRPGAGRVFATRENE